MAKRRNPPASSSPDRPQDGGNPITSKDYEVGYGRPPKAGQFKKGQPRPPRKPKPEAAPDFHAYIAEELALPMAFHDEQGRPQLVPKGKVLAKAVVNKAIKSGELKSLKEFLPQAKAEAEEPFSDIDLKIITQALAHFLKQQPAPSEDDSSEGEDDNYDDDVDEEDAA